MPYETVDELRGSELYKRMDELHGMSTDRLKKFASVFSAVYYRIKRQGGTDNEAESTAIAIALPTARRAAIASMNGDLEEEVHYFTPMMPEQIASSAGETTGQEFTFDFVRNNPELAKLIVRGAAFNWDHEGIHQLGVVRDMLMPAEVPAAVASKMDKDTPFVFTASYYKSIPPEARNEKGISAEWLPLEYASGKKDAIPMTFASSHVPLNAPVTGIARIASLNEAEELKQASDASNKEKDYKEAETASNKGKDTMANDPPAGTAAPPTPTVDIAAFAKLQTDYATDKAALGAALDRVKALETAAAQRDGEEFASALVKDGKIASDAKPAWAALHVADKKQADTLAKTLAPGAHLGESAGKAAANLPALDFKDDQMKALAAASMAILEGKAV